jgi:putative restriction endonuclease
VYKNTNIIDRFLNIKSWKQGDVRAPHKPLLLLYLLAKFARGDKEFGFAEIESDIRSLLRDFGPTRSSYDVNYPFWRLQNDKLWQVRTDKPVVTNRSGDVGRKALVAENARGCFTKDVVEKLSTDTKTVDFLISNLLTQNFPSTIHEDTSGYWISLS